MKAIEKDIYGLMVDTDMFWRVQDIIRKNPRIQKPSAFYRYLGRTYLSHALVGLRRQIKPQKDSISFVGLLADIAKNPEELSLSYYRSLHVHANGPDITRIEFAVYADASGEHVCPDMVKNDKKKIESAVENHEKFADKRIAHLDKREPAVIPKFGELDDCIKLLDKTYVKYHLLFYAESTDTLMPTYQYRWDTIFREPWLVEGGRDE